MKGKIFNAQEVQAMLNGSKVMFREVIKKPFFTKIEIIDGKRTSYPRQCPYKVGQKIFCKESFLQKLGSTQLPSGEHETFFTGSAVEYAADGAQERWDNPDVFYPNWWKKRSAQHMKQEQSRLTLLIKEIRVERLAEISEEDAYKEGVQRTDEWTGCADDLDFTDAFKFNWNATHKKPEEKFEANPWVWVVSFNVIEIG